MKKFLSLFMTLVMMITMAISLPNMVLAEDGEIKQSKTVTVTKDGNGENIGIFEKVDNNMKNLLGDHWESTKKWLVGFGSGTKQLYTTVGTGGFAAFSVLAALACKIVYKVLGFVVRIIWPCEQQPKQQNMYAYN